jgi:hypothetical protein
VRLERELESTVDSAAQHTAPTESPMSSDAAATDAPEAPSAANSPLVPSRSRNQTNVAPWGEGTPGHPPNGGCVATTARMVGNPTDELPIDESRHLVATRTGMLGYPDAHAIGVARCSLRIAAQLEVEEQVKRAVAHGALLHDVGKLRISKRILAKAGPLTRRERLRIREHPLEGQRIVGTEVDRPVAEVVTGHHERWDGGGYPRGLAGEDIPLAARVVAVADAYLAMCEDRPYRARLTEREALRELQECAGSQFDPACVQALVAVVSPD